MIVLTGDNSIHKLIWFYIRKIFKKDVKIVVVDGINKFDPYFISETAFRDGNNPYEVLKKIFVARAFTAFQFQKLMEKIYANKDKKFISVIIGFGYLLNDEYVSFPLAGKILKECCQYASQLNSIVTLPYRETFIKNRRFIWDYIRAHSNVFIEKNSIIKPSDLKKERKKLWEGQLHLLTLH